jgi:hypothetical protein
MAVDIVLASLARHCKLLVNNPDINIVGSTHTWFFRLTIAVILIPGGTELHPGTKME